MVSNIREAQSFVQIYGYCIQKRRPKFCFHCAIILFLFINYFITSSKMPASVARSRSRCRNARKVSFKMVQAHAPSILCETGVLQQLLLAITSTSAYKSLLSKVCDQNTLTFMVRVFLRMQLHKMCERKTKEMGGKRNKRSRKLLKLSPRE